MGMGMARGGQADDAADVDVNDDDDNREDGTAFAVDLSRFVEAMADDGTVFDKAVALAIGGCDDGNVGAADEVSADVDNADDVDDAVACCFFGARFCWFVSFLKNKVLCPFLCPL